MANRILGVTMARGGSKGVSRKNLRELGGKPLIAWTIEEALKCPSLDRHIVTTEDHEIAAVAKEYGAQVCMRPQYLAEDTSSAIDVMQHALDWAEDQWGAFSILADLRTTNPFKTAGDVEAAIGKLVATGADCVAGVTKMEDHHPSRLKMIVADQLVDVWPEPEDGNRQSLKPDVYIRNGSIYVVRTAALREGVFFLGGVTRPWVMPLERSINIDTELDFLTAEALVGMDR